MTLPDDMEPLPEELEMAVEELTGKPTPGNPADRVDALEKRVAYLTQEYNAMGERVGDEDAPDAEKILQGIAADLREARRHLSEWRAQLKGRN